MNELRNGVNSSQFLLMGKRATAVFHGHGARMEIFTTCIQ